MWNIFFGLAFFVTHATAFTLSNQNTILSSSNTILKLRQNKLVMSSSARASASGLTPTRTTFPQTLLKKRQSSSNDTADTNNNTFQDVYSATNGSDERFPYILEWNQREEHARLLTKVHMSYMQHSLLADLTSDKYGMMQKMEKVQFASKEQLLGSSYNYQWQPSSAHAGGLMNDWSLHLE